MSGNLNNQAKAATIGVFDGLHVGHKHLIAQLMDNAATRGLQPTVITFSSHPASLLSHKPAPGKLISESQKKEILCKCGIKNIITLDFNKQIAMLSSKEFLLHIRSLYDIHFLLVGFNHKFGSDRQSTFDDYRHFGIETGVEVAAATPFPQFEVSSSLIRSSIERGNVAQATKLLGRPYCISGTVVEGYHNGAKLGFPTANLNEDNGLMIPANGVYATLVRIDSGIWLPSVCNIGYRPSVSPDGKVTIEVHILDFERSIYGNHLDLQFIEHIRDEKKFPSLDDLKTQLQADCQFARNILKTI